MRNHHVSDAQSGRVVKGANFCALLSTMTTVPVSFVWLAPGPEAVSLLGTWEGATETPLQKQENGSFVAEVRRC